MSGNTTLCRNSRADISVRPYGVAAKLEIAAYVSYIIVGEHPCVLPRAFGKALVLISGVSA